MQSHLPTATRMAVTGTFGSVATLEPVQGGTSEIAFELERFEFSDDDRVEISGRWLGVRGRRFIRPTLTVVTDGRGSRALADLEHKPWAPEEGKLWTAAFSCTLEGATTVEAELNVAPDITITLPAPGQATGAKRSRRERPAREPRARRDVLERQAPPRRTTRPSPESAVRREIAELKAAVEAATVDKERVQGELAAAEAEQAQLRDRIEELTAELDRAVAARKSALAARDQALAASERSAGERDAAVKARDEAVAARDAALKSRDAAIAMREEALNARDESDAAANAALLARDHALAQRDASETARDRAVADRETLVQTADQLRTQREDDLATRGAQLVMRNATIASGAARRHAGWTQRTVAIIVVLAVVLALLIVTHVL
jgi:uncharacterized protein (DUF3084 family)